MAFTTSQAGIDLITPFEGCELTAYQDTGGVWTIGYGHTAGVYPDMVITQAQAVEFFRQDVKGAENTVNNKVAYSIAQNTFDALVSLTLNTGPTAFSNSTLLRLLNQRDINGVADQFDVRIYDNHVTQPGLVRRRAAEKAMLLNGIPVPSNEIPVSAQLTTQGTNVDVGTSPNTSATIVKKLNTGASAQVTGRILVNGDSWFRIVDGWISGDYVQGWVKDYNDNNRWWYVEKGYAFPISVWKAIAEKDYCFGMDGYLFVERYIKPAVNNTYYWVDDDGVYLNQHDTATPGHSYRVVENCKTENVYQG